MTESEMKSAVQSLRTMDIKAIKSMIASMQKTHASDHVTPTHTNLDPDRPKSFYMKRSAVSEVQGTKEGKVSWVAKGEVQNIVSVPGVVPATAEDEAKILAAVLTHGTEYMVVSADDKVGAKCLYITGIPAAYAGFAYLTERNAGLGKSVDSVSLPIEVHYNVVCIGAAGNTKLLSTYPAPQSYIDGLGKGFRG